MPLKLPAQTTLGGHRSGKDEQAGSVLVQAMHDAQSRQRPLVKSALNSSKVLADQVFQSGRQGLSLRRPFALGRMANRVNAGGLLDHDQVFVEMTNREELFKVRRRERPGQQFKALAGLDAPSGI